VVFADRSEGPRRAYCADRSHAHTIRAEAPWRRSKRPSSSAQLRPLCQGGVRGQLVTRMPVPIRTGTADCVPGSPSPLAPGERTVRNSLAVRERSEASRTAAESVRGREKSGLSGSDAFCAACGRAGVVEPDPCGDRRASGPAAAPIVDDPQLWAPSGCWALASIAVLISDGWWG
jgi:hypothetical protein